MKLLRPLFILLLLVNLVLVLANLGGFARAPGGEPDRLSSQLHPEKIRILDPQTEDKPAAAASEPVPAPEVAPTAGESEVAPEPASASVPAGPVALACASWAGLTRAQADGVLARGRRAEFRVNESSTTAPASWWIHLPPQPDRAAAERKAGELRELGVTDFFIVNDAGPTQFAVSLGLYKSEESAKRALDQLRGRGVQTARIAVREATTTRVEVSGPADRLAGFASDTAAALPGATRGECTPVR